MNKINLVGRITKEFTKSVSQSGNAYGYFTLAVSRKTNLEETDFINCTAFSHNANYLENFAKKGNLLSVSGHLQVDYNAEKKMNFYNVIVEEVSILTPKPKETSNEIDSAISDFPVEKDDLGF
jgi:single-strand DNA-binding protein